MTYQANWDITLGSSKALGCFNSFGLIHLQSQSRIISLEVNKSKEEKKKEGRIEKEKERKRKERTKERQKERK
jgi:hypothetical protein